MDTACPFLGQQTPGRRWSLRSVFCWLPPDTAVPPPLAGPAAGSSAAPPGPPHRSPPGEGGIRRAGRRARAGGPGGWQPTAPPSITRPGPAPAASGRQGRTEPPAQNTGRKGARDAHAHRDGLTPTALVPTGPPLLRAPPRRRHFPAGNRTRLCCRSRRGAHARGAPLPWQPQLFSAKPPAQRWGGEGGKCGGDHWRGEAGQPAGCGAVTEVDGADVSDGFALRPAGAGERGHVGQGPRLRRGGGRVRAGVPPELPPLVVVRGSRGG